ncbi:MAG: hypothetical protein WAM79_17380 [Candidatus Sulfotelmatobacter sp.]
MRHGRSSSLVVILAAAIAHNAIAQCPHAITCDRPAATARSPQGEAAVWRTRTVLLDLELTDSGTVRGVSVWGGEAPLRSEAIKAAARRRYTPRVRKPNVVSVEVRFPIDKRALPDVHEITIGVSSCIPGGRITNPGPMVHLSPESLNHLVPMQPVIIIPEPSERK